MTVVDAVFTRDGDAFVPTEYALGPWSADALHGGPPAALLARCIERHADDPEMQVARLTIDLSRAVPNARLRAHVETVRGGRRLVTVHAVLLADGIEVTRASALLLRRSDAPVGGASYPPPPGPEGIETTTGLMRFTAPLPGFPPRTEGGRPRFEGFHTRVESRWLPESEGLPAVWLRMPVPLVEGEETSPVARAAALADFGSPISNLVGGRAQGMLPYINADITLYLHRPPEGEWLCLQADHRDELDGVGLAEAVWYDVRGRYGRAVQARLANARG